MFNEIWLHAWMVSAAISVGAFFCFRRAGVPNLDAMLLAAACFPAPVLYLVNGAASELFLFDLFAPAAIYSGWKSRLHATPRVRRAAFFLLMGAAIVPLALAALVSGERSALLFNLANTYRLAGALFLMIRLNAIARRSPLRSSWWRLAFSWIAIVLFAAMMLQAFGGFNTDIFYSSADILDGTEQGDARFVVLGLFRGSLGILGIIAVCAFVADQSRRDWKWVVSLLGLLCGCAVIILSGSKTSFLAVPVVLILRLALLRKVRADVNVACVAVLMLCTLALLPSGLLVNYMPGGMAKFLTSGGTERATLESREDIWAAAALALRDHPAIAVGLPRKGAVVLPGWVARTESLTPFLPGVYHNEYLAIFMLGGVWSLAAYSYGLWLLGSYLIAASRHSELTVFAGLTFVCGLIEACAVNHFQPGVLFLPTVVSSCAIYALGLSGQSKPKLRRLNLRRIRVADQQCIPQFP